MEAYTIITSTRNRPVELMRSLSRTRAAVGEEIAIVVFDDASDDNGAVERAVASIPNLQVIRSARQLGPGAGRNACMRAAETEYCLSLDDDCYLSTPPDIARWLENRPTDRDVAAVGFRYFNTKTGEFSPGPAAMGPAATIPGGASLLRRKAVLQAGGYLEWLFFGVEDSELGKRLSRLGYRIWQDPAIVVYHEHAETARDEQSAALHYVRNTYLINVMHQGLALGAILGLPRAVRRGLNTVAPWMTLAGLWAGLRMTPFCLKERKRLFHPDRRWREVA